MNTIALSSVLLTFLFTSPADTLASVSDNVYYEQIVHQAHTNCKNRKPEKVDVSLLWKLVKVEKIHGVPKELQGMLLAAACSESGYNPDALGDRKFSKKRIPKAVGILQLWPWWERGKYGYKVNRRDPVASAHAWLTHIARQIPKVRRKCKFKKKKKIWIAAWVTAIRSPKPGGRCYERPKHLRILKKWKREIKKKNRAARAS